MTELYLHKRLWSREVERQREVYPFGLSVVRCVYRSWPVTWAYSACAYDLFHGRL